MLIVATAAAEQHRISSTTQFIQSRWMSECCEIIFCCWICALKAVLVTIVYWTLLLDSEALKLLHRHRIGRLFWPILSTIGFRTIVLTLVLSFPSVLWHCWLGDRKASGLWKAGCWFVGGDLIVALHVI